MAHIIFAKKLFTGEQLLNNQLVYCEKGAIVSVRDGIAAEADQEVACLSAGFIDIHINGGSRHHFTAEPEEQTVRDIAESSEALGTAYTLPTLVTSPVENILKGIGAVRAFMAAQPGKGVIGMHLEGPFIHPIKRGAHLTKYLLQPTDELIEKIAREGSGVIALITIAPELFSDRQIAMLMEAGITVSAGHSNATYEEGQSAFAKGIRLVTHLYNAMSGFSHRAPGLVGAAFDNGDVYAPIILDGAHCHFASARIAYRAKKEKLFLISDALFTGDQMSFFKWDHFDSYLRDGRYVNSEGNLAGAAICMGDAVRNAVHQVGIGLQEAVEMATIRPAEALGLQQQLGRVQPGYPAVFTGFDDSLQSFSVIRIR